MYCVYYIVHVLAAELSSQLNQVVHSVLFDIYANGVAGQHSLPCSDTKNCISFSHYGSAYSYL